MTTLYEVGKEISANLELGPRLALICEKAAQTTGAKGAIMFLRREGESEFVAAASHNLEGTSTEEPARFVAGESDLGLCAHEQRPVRRSTGAGELEVPGLPGGVSTLLAVPLVAEGRVLGVLAVVDK
ncbi:MAG: GAF domain-containing protein, partial [Candidatus Eisenbacteria bacterium]